MGKGALDIVNGAFIKLESTGLIKKTPNYIYDYEKDYPKLRLLEENYEVIRRECESILSFHNEITDMDKLSGYTAGSIHTAKWKSFMFKSGVFVKENCDLCPETTRLLKKIPKLRTAFFSILSPNQHIAPHRGYFNGFLRYHLGVIIPNNNKSQECWLRITNGRLPRAHIEELGEKYYWKNGEGIVFNDNYTHDACNDSDQIRVVLFLDMERKLPFPFSILNTLILNIAYSTKEAKRIARNAVIKIPTPQS